LAKFPQFSLRKPYIQHQHRRTWQIEGWTWQDWAPLISRYLGEIGLSQPALEAKLVPLLTGEKTNERRKH